MAKYVITHGGANKGKVNGKRTYYAKGEQVAFDELPTNLAGKVRKIPDAVETTTTKSTKTTK